MKEEGRRSQRVAELIRARLTDALRREFDDPVLLRVTIVKVHVSDDLSLARSYIRLLGDDKAEERKRALARLSRARHRLLRAILPGLELRRAPELRFSYDEGQDATARVAEL